MHRRMFAVLLAFPMIVSAQRTVSDNQILSPALPAATLEAAAGMTYAGTQSFELYGVAMAEQHFFVELDGTRVKRVLWVQYEGYHATNHNTYNYTDTTITHAGQTWHRDRTTWRPNTGTPRAGGDGARMRAFIAAKGWILPNDMLYERLVWLLDAPPRNELMVIYAEDLTDHGMTAADLGPEGSARDRRPAILEQYHQRALAAFTVR